MLDIVSNGINAAKEKLSGKAMLTEERTETQSAKVGRADLATSIRQAGVTGNDLRCEVSGGILTLFGFVRSFYEKQVAQEVVRESSGVQRVSNQLVVRS